MTTSKPSTSVTTGRVAVPGAEIYFELRGSGPLHALHAAPMDAESFQPIAELLARDHTVLTSDPRGINRSTVEDETAEATPDQRADDLARLLTHVDLGPADLLGSSGGAISALALLQSRPDLMRTVVAHEPPVAVLLPDVAQIRQSTDEMIQAYLDGDRRGYWERFLAQAGIELPPELFEAWFAEPLTGQPARDERYAVERMDRATTFWQPNLNALRDADGLVIGIGEESAGQLCDRASRALGEAVGIQPVLFPGDHTGFVEHADQFAVRLREILAR